MQKYIFTNPRFPWN